MVLVDIGANLQHKSFKHDLDDVLARAQNANVQHVIVTGTSVDASREAIRLAKSHPGFLYATVGIHPHDSQTCNSSDLAILENLVAQNAGIVVAVGETGLDFNRDFSPRDVQMRVFEAQLDMACRLKKPLFLHERDAHAEFVRILDARAGQLPPAVVHCFTGTRDELAAYVRRGFYIGVTGFLAMEKRGRDLRSWLALEVPLDRLMIETDAPFMAPDGAQLLKHRRNEPYTLPVVAQAVALCYNVPVDQVARTMTENTRRFFSI